jgi:hypothetical protein
MTNASSKVKIVVSVVVAAAVVATSIYSSASSAAAGLKGGSRNLQFGGIVIASSQGGSVTVSNVNIGIPSVIGALAALPTGTGNSFGNGGAVGTSNGFAGSQLGAASATGTAGGNSTTFTNFSLLDATGVAGTGSGLATSIGDGSGRAGGNAVFGPSLAAAIAAATPANTPAPVAVAVQTNDKKKGGKDKGGVTIPVADVPKTPEFSFVLGLPTGGGGGGNGVGSGLTNVGVSTIAGETVDEAYGSLLANGFGFGVGSGVAINNGGEQAGGQGGGTAFGQGNVVFEIDEAFGATFANNGLTKSSGGGGAYVGFAPPAAQIFGAFSNP